MEILQVSTGTRSIEASGSWRTVIGIAFLWPVFLALGMIFMVGNFRPIVHHASRIDDILSPKARDGSFIVVVSMRLELHSLKFMVYLTRMLRQTHASVKKSMRAISRQSARAISVRVGWTASVLQTRRFIAPFLA